MHFCFFIFVFLCVFYVHICISCHFGIINDDDDDDMMLCVQAAYTMCNIAAHGDSFCALLLDEGAFKEFIPLFRSTDTDTVHYALSFCEMLLHSSSTVSLLCYFYAASCSSSLTKQFEIVVLLGKVE